MAVLPFFKLVCVHGFLHSNSNRAKQQDACPALFQFPVAQRAIFTVPLTDSVNPIDQVFLI
jgi:hypothetical protein